MTGTLPIRGSLAAAGRASAFGAVLAVGVACVDPPPRTRTEPEPVPTRVVVDTVVVQEIVRDTVTVSNPETEQEVARLQLQVLEREAQIQELQDQLDQATQEVVRSMARLQTNASRAEAASAMAEAEVALEQLKAATGGRETPETERVQTLLNNSTNAFNAGNFGGSLYLANSAKTLARDGREGLLPGAQGELLAGETPFTVALPLQTLRRSNVRQGPGTEHDIAFTLEPGVPLTGHSYVGQWVRISAADGRTGWIFQTLVEARGGVNF